MLHRHIPQVLDLTLKDLTLVDASAMLPSPWKGLGRIEVDVIFWLIMDGRRVPRD